MISTAIEEHIHCRDNNIELLKNRLQFRDGEVDLLLSLISRDLEHPRPHFIVSGFKSVGKTRALEGVLNATDISFTVIKCNECITRRLLLQRCYSKIRDHAGLRGDEENSNAIRAARKGIAAFISELEVLFNDAKYTDPHVLVLDNIDQCFEPVADLIPALSKIREQSSITNLQIIFVLTTEVPRQVASGYLPLIHFNGYTEQQVAGILAYSDICHSPVPGLDGMFWRQFSQMMVDLFFAYTGSDLGLMFDLCRKIWPQFIQPVISGQCGTNDFVKIYRANQGLFQESYVVASTSIASVDNAEGAVSGIANVGDLPVHSKFIVIASYLASFNDFKSDVHYFSKLKASKRRKRKESRKGMVSKEDVDKRMLAAGWFDLERLTAILSVIYRDSGPGMNSVQKGGVMDFSDEKMDTEESFEAERNAFSLSKDIDLNSQVATLMGLGLLVRTAILDILNPRLRWKTNVKFEVAESLAQNLGFSIADYLSVKE